MQESANKNGGRPGKTTGTPDLLLSVPPFGSCGRSSYAARLRRNAIAMMPTNPLPNSVKVAGSGTGATTAVKVEVPKP
jgi:hypothetical protein